jgi:hypothetical protein
VPRHQHHHHHPHPGAVWMLFSPSHWNQEEEVCSCGLRYVQTAGEKRWMESLGDIGRYGSNMDIPRSRMVEFGWNNQPICDLYCRSSWMEAKWQAWPVSSWPWSFWGRCNEVIAILHSVHDIGPAWQNNAMEIQGVDQIQSFDSGSADLLRQVWSWISELSSSDLHLGHFKKTLATLNCETSAILARGLPWSYTERPPEGPKECCQSSCSQHLV